MRTIRKATKGPCCTAWAYLPFPGDSGWEMRNSGTVAAGPITVLRFLPGGRTRGYGSPRYPGSRIWPYSRRRPRKLVRYKYSIAKYATACTKINVDTGMDRIELLITPRIRAMIGPIQMATRLLT